MKLIRHANGAALHVIDSYLKAVTSRSACGELVSERIPAEAQIEAEIGFYS